MTVVETRAFVEVCKGRVSDDECLHIVNFLAGRPDAGLSLGGGLRKVRIPRAGGGKSGGYRVVCLFANIGMPIFLLTLVSKNEK